MNEKKADGWVIRCPTCGKTRPFPGVRIGAASVGKRVLAICTECKGLKWAHVERGSATAQG